MSINCRFRFRGGKKNRSHRRPLLCVKKMRRIRPFARSLRVASAKSPRATARASVRFVHSSSLRASRDVPSLPPSRAPSRRSSSRGFSRFVRALGRDVCKVKGPSAGGGVSGQARASSAGTSVARGAAPVIPTRPVTVGARSRKGGGQTRTREQTITNRGCRKRVPRREISPGRRWCPHRSTASRATSVPTDGDPRATRSAPATEKPAFSSLPRSLLGAGD